ncbi:hypothetical protein B0J13DRAFT_105585 [Dactylonectria estremocensis]|uniref:Transmembrane protein n=1 Tax=Dactylonectria estremocensis TaxID=1079267 RepID=A0A9P9E7R9_9HYPO|nr:hypothetical protein B0J13DRAFT_105585 [Dactylonectria estremocensis]
MGVGHQRKERKKGKKNVRLCHCLLRFGRTGDRARAGRGHKATKKRVLKGVTGLRETARKKEGLDMGSPGKEIVSLITVDVKVWPVWWTIYWRRGRGCRLVTGRARSQRMAFVTQTASLMSLFVIVMDETGVVVRYYRVSLCLFGLCLCYPHALRRERQQVNRCQTEPCMTLRIPRYSPSAHLLLLQCAFKLPLTVFQSGVSLCCFSFCLAVVVPAHVLVDTLSIFFGIFSSLSLFLFLLLMLSFFACPYPAASLRNLQILIFFLLFFFLPSLQVLA